MLEAEDLDDALFRETLELSARALLQYVLYRRHIIDELAGIKGHEREDRIHELVVPRYHTLEGDSVANDLYRNNVWLFDDKFMTYRTLLSEGDMDEVLTAITGDDHPPDAKRPDISLIFSGDPKGDKPVDGVIIELKKREADDRDGLYVVTQLIRRAETLVEHWDSIQRAWYYGVVEFDDDLKRHLRNRGWARLYSKGLMFYREFPVHRKDDKIIPTSVFLMSWDSVVDDASARNHAFEELLRNQFAAVAESAN